MKVSDLEDFQEEAQTAYHQGDYSGTINALERVLEVRWTASFVKLYCMLAPIHGRGSPQSYRQQQFHQHVRIWSPSSVGFLVVFVKIANVRCRLRSLPGIRSRGSFVQIVTCEWGILRKPSRISRPQPGYATTTAQPSWSSAGCCTTWESITTPSSERRAVCGAIGAISFIWASDHLFGLPVPSLPSVALFLCSHIRECLKLDQDDKECFSHYKQVKKLSKQLDSAEELIQGERSVPSWFL